MTRSSRQTHHPHLRPPRSHHRSNLEGLKNPKDRPPHVPRRLDQGLATTPRIRRSPKPKGQEMPETSKEALDRLKNRSPVMPLGLRPKARIQYLYEPEEGKAAEVARVVALPNDRMLVVLYSGERLATDTSSRIIQYQVSPYQVLPGSYVGDTLFIDNSDKAPPVESWCSEDGTAWVKGRIIFANEHGVQRAINVDNIAVVMPSDSVLIRFAGDQDLTRIDLSFEEFTEAMHVAQQG